MNTQKLTLKEEINAILQELSDTGYLSIEDQSDTSQITKLSVMIEAIIRRIDNIGN
jgi:hypothetical protein